MGKISINIKSGKLEKESDVVVGIDLGTTNSLVAIVDSVTGQAVALSKDKNSIVPSIVYLPETGQPVVGKDAIPALIQKPESTIFSVKRLLGRSYKDLEKHSEMLSYKIVDEDNEQLVRVEANGRYYSPVELSSMILSELKNRAEDCLQRKVSRAVITVPAYFNDNQRQATRDAGKMAGLDVLRIINEPTAASLAYGLNLGEAMRVVAVYDLGGGTFDITILRIESGVFEVLSTNGDTYLGGDDFDKAIVMEWLQKNGLQMDQNAANSRNYRVGLQNIRLLAEEAKKHVCSTGTDFSSQFEWFGQTYNCSLSSPEFETLIEPIVKRTLDACRKCVADSGLKYEEIEEVVLVGGSTRVPLVKKMVSNLFSSSKINAELDPDEVVALGAAVEADILAGNRSDILLLDVTPLSLGIETAGGLMDVIIPRNTKIPARVGRQYTTSVDGQVNLQISVYQGERELVAENRKLAEFVLKGIPAMPAGMPKVEIGFMLDADGILKVQAEELRSGVKQEIQVKPQYGLSDEMVEKMLLDSMEHAKEDIEKRMLLEAIEEGKQLVYTVKNFIHKNSSWLGETEINRSLQLSEELEQQLQSANRDKILYAIDSLNEYTRPFAERLMDMAVGNALKGTDVNNNI